MTLEASNLTVSGTVVSFNVNETGSGVYTYTVSDPVANSNKISITVTATTVTPPPQSGNICNIHVITWAPTNGFSAIPWGAPFNQISIFVWQPTSTGSGAYDGGTTTNIAGEIATAQMNGAKALLACGGYGLPAVDGVQNGTITTILGSAAVQNTLIANVLAEVKAKGYNGIEWDFENYNAGDFSATQYTAFIQNLYTKMKAQSPGLVLAVCYASWMSESINIGALEPYVDYIYDMVYPETSSLSAFESQVAGDAALLKSPGTKLKVGFQMGTAAQAGQSTNVTAAEALPMMQYCVSKGYGTFFWQAAINNGWTAEIIAAGI